MGLLRELSHVQETYRGMLQDLRGIHDKTFDDAILSAPGMDEDNVVTVACILFELEAKSPQREPTQNDLLWAIEFIDHLDTLGKEVCNK